MNADLELTRWSLLRQIWGVTLSVLVPLLMVSAVAWAFLPPRVVIQYSAGQADGSTDPTVAVLAVPGLLLAIAAVVSVWVAAGPEVPSSRWKGCWMALVVLIAVIHLALVLGSV